MRRLSLIGMLGVLALPSRALLAQALNDNIALQKVEGRDRPTGSRADRWRYRYYNDRWWYYHSNNQWSYWNGSAWTPYSRQTYRQRSGSDLQSYSRDGGNGSYGYRSPGFIQHQKNEARDQSLEAMSRRRPGTIQRQKNEARRQSFDSIDIRPPGTIQREKNEPR